MLFFTLLINLSIHRISYVSLHLINFFVVTMAAMLEAPSRVYLLGKSAQMCPTNMGAAHIFGFTFETIDAQCSLL